MMDHTVEVKHNPDGTYILSITVGGVTHAVQVADIETAMATLEHELEVGVKC